MIPAKGYAAASAKVPLAPLQFERREGGPHDVQIGILCCGVWQSDIHLARDKRGGSIFPMVPRHETVGKVTKVGGQVTKFKDGQTAGVGCFDYINQAHQRMIAGDVRYRFFIDIASL